MRPVFIFDLDGTLSDCSHRIRMAKSGDWDGFFAACFLDTPIYPVIQTANALARFADIWVWTGRNNSVYQKTQAWLAMNSVPFQQLRMRREEDHRPDYVLKREWANDLSGHDRDRVVAVFEDRDRVVQMWRDIGFTCFQVAEGGY
jgi:phosphoglycolate phosphatase-like HAD superfamily hydrolase